MLPCAPPHPVPDAILLCKEYSVNHLSLKENNVLCYIAGYIVKRIHDKICAPCYNKIVSSTGISKDNPHHGFLAAKSYTDLLHGLYVPGILLTELIQSLEIKYSSLIDNVNYLPLVHSPLLLHFLMTLTLKIWNVLFVM